MLKKLIGLVSRKVTPQDPPMKSGTSAWIDYVVSQLRDPSNLEEERSLSDLAASSLGEEALALLPSISSRLSETGWEVGWANGKIKFVFAEARKRRYLELLDEIVSVSRKSDSRLAEMYLTGLCSAFVELDVWLKERLGDGDMLDIEEALKLALADGWTFKFIQNESGQRFFCSVKAPSDLEDREGRPEAAMAAAPTIH